jgi:hypothetical protein
MKLQHIILVEANLSGTLYRNSLPFDLLFYVFKGTKDAPMGRNKKTMKQKDVLHANQPHKIGGKKVKGSSFTRNKNQAFKLQSFGPVVLEIDARKLSQRHKIIPVDGEYLHYLARTKRSASDPKAQKAWKDFNDKSGGTGTHELGRMAEEFVVGDIPNLSRYLKAIHVLPDAKTLPYYEEFMHAAKEYSEEFGVPIHTRGS